MSGGGKKENVSRKGLRNIIDAGVPSDAGRTGGLPAPLESLGRFRDAGLDVAIDVLKKEGMIGADPTTQILKRGTLDDIRIELTRLKTLRYEFSAWANNFPELAQDKMVVTWGSQLDANTRRLETYVNERQPTMGLKGDADVKILFDGRQLVIHKPTQPSVVFDEGVTSGKDDLSSLKNTSKKAQQEIDRGPIPEGIYWVDLRQIDTVLNPLDWYGWGLERLTIHPFETTETFGRGGLFFHGGAKLGSGGCIDFPWRLREFFDALVSRMPASKSEKPDLAYRVKLVVDYSSDKVRWAKAQLEAHEREDISKKMSDILHKNNPKGYTSKELTALERSFGMKVSEEATKGKFSDPLIWNIAAWQKQLQAQKIDTGGVDGIIGKKTRPLFEKRISPYLPTTDKATYKERKIHRVIRNITEASYNQIIDRIAAKEKIDPNLVRGIIAVESGGRIRATAKSNYRGLMQAGHDKRQMDPENSICTGIRKYKGFEKFLSHTLKKYNQDFKDASDQRRIGMCMVAYNAGPATVRKAMEYANDAGNVKRWFESENFQRALVFYGAYSPKVTLPRRLKGLDGNVLAKELVKLLGKSNDEIRAEFHTPKGWNASRLRSAIIDYAEQERKTLRKKNLTMEQVRARASQWLLDSVESKYTKLPGYINRVLKYKRDFEQAGQVTEKRGIDADERTGAVTPSDAGIIRPAGVKPPLEALGSFRDAKSVKQVVDRLNKWLEKIPKKERELPRIQESKVHPQESKKERELPRIQESKVHPQESKKERELRVEGGGGGPVEWKTVTEKPGHIGGKPHYDKMH